jgi:hypothetical protein
LNVSSPDISSSTGTEYGMNSVVVPNERSVLSHSIGLSATSNSQESETEQPVCVSVAVNITFAAPAFSNVTRGQQTVLPFKLVISSETHA